MGFDRGVQFEMKIRVLSDLHLEFQDWVPPKSDADIVVLAGDIHVGIRGIEWARRSFPLLPVVEVDVLDGRGAIVGGVRFLGATLWTDFALHGAVGGESLSRFRRILNS
jgi:hypothetical protein